MAAEAGGLPRRLPRNRNRWLALGAAVFAVAQLPLLAAGILRLDDSSHQTVKGWIIDADLLRVVAPIAGFGALALASRALARSPANWRRMRLPAAIWALGAAVLLLASGCEREAVLESSFTTADYRLVYWLAAGTNLGLLLAAILAYAAFHRDDALHRSRRLGLAGLLTAVAYGLAAAAALVLEAFYRRFEVPGELLSGLMIGAGGSAIFAIAAAVAGFAFLAGVGRREAFLAAAAALAAVGFTLVAAGEALVALAYEQTRDRGHPGTVTWLTVGFRAAEVIALCCVAIGAWTAARQSRDARAVRS